MKRVAIFVFAAGLVLGCAEARAQKLSAADKKYSELANYDESKVPQYTLPDPLVSRDGTRVTDARTWERKRRPEVFAMFETYMFGKAPGRPKAMHFEVKHIDPNALDGRATRKDVEIYFTAGESDPSIKLQVYTPNGVAGPVPMFLGISFMHNCTVTDDPGVEVPETVATGRTPKRGAMKEAWQLDMILENGYGLATYCYTDIDPDFDDDFQNGIHPLFYTGSQQRPDPDQWGSIAAWAWGMSRAMDYLEKDKDVDSKHVAVIGHSRLGKTAVWAGASDPRFAMVLSGNSGCCGVAISRRMYGETIEAMNVRFPHWFCGNYKQFNNREMLAPFDQHELVALIAPRPIYIASAETDNWSDQKGEFLGGKGAEPVYALYGLKGIGTDTMPGIDEPYADGHIAYHIRKGPHAVLRFDWEQFIKFADLHFRGKK